MSKGIAMQGMNKKMQLSAKKRRQGWPLLAPMILAFTVSYLLPFAIALVRSFFRGMSGEFVGLENYVDLFKNRTFGLALHNLVTLWAVVLPLNLGIGFLLAVLANNARCEKSRIFFLLPAVLPAACVVGIVQDWLGTVQCNGLLTFLPLGWQDSTAAGGVFVGIVLWKGLGYTVLILSVAMASVPIEYRQAAQIDGAGEWTILRKIYLPLLSPALLASAIMAVYNSFRCFREALLLGGNHPEESLYSLQHFLQNNFTNMNFARLESACVLLVSVPAVVAWLLYRGWKRRDT